MNLYATKLNHVELRAITRLKNFYLAQRMENDDLTVDERAILSSCVKILKNQDLLVGVADFVRSELKDLKKDNIHLQSGFTYDKGRYDAFRKIQNFIKR